MSLNWLWLPSLVLMLILAPGMRRLYGPMALGIAVIAVMCCQWAGPAVILGAMLVTPADLFPGNRSPEHLCQ